MNRRPRLPGADELFRATGGAAQTAALAEVGVQREERSRRHAAPSAVPSHRPEAVAAVNGAPSAAPPSSTGSAGPDETWDDDDRTAPARPVRIARRNADARPTGRERHDEKITVYCSPEELLQLEQARLTLRGAHGLAVDRGRIVREAIAVVLADLEAKGDASILVRRLRGR
jgi:hypothetical protein